MLPNIPKNSVQPRVPYPSVPKITSFNVRPLEIRAMNNPTNGAYTNHQAQQNIVHDCGKLSFEILPRPPNGSNHIAILKKSRNIKLTLESVVSIINTVGPTINTNDHNINVNQILMSLNILIP